MAKTASDFQAVLPAFPCKALSEYRVESLLGGGGFSHVVLARDSAGAEWALKLIPAPGAACLEEVDTAPLLLSEARVHLLLSTEPSVLPCVEAFKSVYADERGGGGGRPATFMAVLRMPVAACSVEEWLFSVAPLQSGCKGGPQLRVDAREVLSVWLQMVNAVYRCHMNGVVHKDIKLPNFLMDHKGKVQIMDFGLAQVEGVTPRQVVGTPWTMSPAAFKHGDDGRAGDWWSLGVVLYQLMQGGAWPFKQCWWPWQKGGGERMETAIRRAVLAGHITFRDSAAVPEPVKALIRGLLQPDPNRRWQLRQVLASEAISPSMLVDIGERFTELRPDMEALLRIQSRAREVKGMGPDGPAMAAGGSTLAPAAAAVAGSRVAAAASNLLWRGASAVSAVAGEGGLHWPLGHHRHGGRGLGGAGGDEEASYQPLLEGDQQGADERGGQEGARSVEADTATAGGRGLASASPISVGGTVEASRLQPQQQQQLQGARVEDLLLIMPDERTPVTPRAGGGAGTSTATDGPETESGRMRHAATTSSIASGNAARATHWHIDTVSGSSGLADGPASGPGSQPLPSHRSMSGSQSAGAQAHPSWPSPRRSRTSLHELFGLGQASLEPPLLLLQQQQQPQPHVRADQPRRATSGGRLGDPLAYAGDRPGAPRRHSWMLQWQQGPLSQQSPRQPHGNGDAAGPAKPPAAGDGVLTVSPALQLPQSSWVPPPPEVFATGRFNRCNDASSFTATGTGGKAVGGSRAHLPASPGFARGHGLGPHPEASPGRRLLARARRLFTDCLQRPSVKHELLEDEEVYDMH